jgi:L-malate glycosyltransferase
MRQNGLEVFMVVDLDPAAPRMGGVAAYSSRLIEYLSKAGIRATLLGAGRKQAAADDGQYVAIVDKPGYSGYEYLLKLMARAPFLSIPKSAIIHTQHPEYMLPFALFHPRNPKIMTVHGQVLNKINFKRTGAVRLTYGSVESFVFKHSDLVQVVDKDTREFYEKQYPWLPRPELISTGIDLEKFKPLDRQALRIKYGFAPEDKVVAYVGRLEKEKGLDFLIECGAPLAQMVPGALIVLVGGGREAEHLQSAAAGVKNVRFMGAQPPDAIPALMNCADVLALCSVYEGSPTVVKEALACGVPVVSTDVGDVGQVISDGKTGRIVPRDVKDYVQALASLLLDERKEDTRRECVRAAAEFGFDRVGAKTVELYRRLADKAGTI